MNDFDEPGVEEFYDFDAEQQRLHDEQEYAELGGEG